MLTKSETQAEDTLDKNTNIIEVKDLIKQYGKTIAVNNLSFSITKGEIFGLLGPNGAGKTSTLEIIEGIQKQDSGEVHVFGLDVRKYRKKIQTRIGVQIQCTTLFPELNVHENIELFSSFYPHTLPVAKLIEMVALQEKARAYPGNLSGGQRQRLALALALVNDPEIVFLDEPTTGLDPQSRRSLWEMVEGLRDAGKTVVLTTHFMDEAEYLCDRIAIIDHGQIIAQDTTAGLLTSLGSSARIEWMLNGTARTFNLDLATLPAVKEVEHNLDRVRLFTSHTEQTLAALLQLATAQGISLDNLHIQTPTLEDVFLKLTGRKLRD